MFGICYHNIVTVRTNPSHKEEVCTQLLFGDTYEIIDQQEDWFKIRISFDNYEGWIDEKLHTEVLEEFYHQYQEQKAVYVTEKISNVFDQLVVLGSQIPLPENYKGEHNQNTSHTVRSLALKYWNTPYLWGGKTIFGIDCSGFAQQVFKMLGHNLLRDAYEQAEQGTRIEFKNQQEGDLAFFKNEKGRITHVGIILENYQIIHAHGLVRIDGLRPDGIWNVEKEYLSHSFSHIQRIF